MWFGFKFRYVFSKRFKKSPIFLRYKVVSKGLGDDFQFFGLLRMFELYQTALLNKVGQISVLNAYSFFFQFQDIQ